MGTRIIDFSDESYLEFAVGRFDAYCVYMCDGNGSRTAPADPEYFADLLEIAKNHGSEKIWGDSVEVYGLTTHELNSHVYEYISTAVDEYNPDQLLVEKTLFVLYAGMVAENNKINTK